MEGQGEERAAGRGQENKARAREQGEGKPRPYYRRAFVAYIVGARLVVALKLSWTKPSTQAWPEQQTSPSRAGR